MLRCMQMSINKVRMITQNLLCECTADREKSMREEKCIQQQEKKTIIHSEKCFFDYIFPFNSFNSLKKRLRSIIVANAKNASDFRSRRFFIRVCPLCSDLICTDRLSTLCLTIFIVPRRFLFCLVRM